MNHEWSEKNKRMQSLIGKEATGKGFYANGNDGNAVKALGLFIRKYGKKELGSVMDRLHQKYDFRKIQEIIGYDIYEGLKILEENRQ